MNQKTGGIWRRAYEYAALWFGLGTLGAGCLLWCLVAALLHPLLPRPTGTRLGRLVIMRGFRFYLWLLQAIGACRFDLSALDPLREEGAVVIATGQSAWPASCARSHRGSP